MNPAEPANNDSVDVGVLLLQIDGLSHAQFQDAMTQGNLPFLKHLSQTGDFTLVPFYSGLPSTTPAVQAELFFGITSAVPAMRFFSRETGEDWLMLNPFRVRQFTDDVLPDHRGLLEKGSSYSNIFIGGAKYARYCIETLEPENFLKRMRPLQTFRTLIQHCGNYGRIFLLAGKEIFIALADSGRDNPPKRRIFKELSFLPARIWVGIVLRELIRLRVKLDISGGIPIICANFAGYDEHAHRRGPDSLIANRSLRGIDAALESIVKEARKSRRRRYKVVVFSDHGQEKTRPYQKAYGESLSEGVQKAFSHGPLNKHDVLWTEEQLSQKLFSRSSRRLLKMLQNTLGREQSADPQQILVNAAGPLGHIYLPQSLDDVHMKSCAKRLVTVGHIPLVLYRRRDGKVLAFNHHGQYHLPEQALDILGKDHPCPHEAGRDLVRLVTHRNAGDFVISGWIAEGQPVTFPLENGAHGGPGRRECQGFLLLPSTLDQLDNDGNWRPMRLRQAVHNILFGPGDGHAKG